MSRQNRQNGTPLWVEALLNRDLSAMEFRVWMLLHRYQGRNGSAWPSQETIATDLGLATESVRRIVKRLEAKGWLTVTRPAHTAPGRGVQYTVEHPTARLGEHPTGELGDSPEHPTGQAENTPPAKPRHKGRIQSGSQSTPKQSYALAELLLSEIRVWKPDLKTPNLDQWARDIELMLRRDKRTPEGIETVIRWCQADNFWRSNILSAAKLRKQYDTLDAQRISRGGGQQNRKPEPESPPVVRDADGLTPRERALMETPV